MTTPLFLLRCVQLGISIAVNGKPYRMLMNGYKLALVVKFLEVHISFFTYLSYISH